MLTRRGFMVAAFGSAVAAVAAPPPVETLVRTKRWRVSDGMFLELRVREIGGRIHDETLFEIEACRFVADRQESDA